MFSAVAAALRRRLHDSSQGEVPMVKFAESETTVWKVCSLGREISADWLVIQMCRTESKVLAKTILYERSESVGYVLFTRDVMCLYSPYSPAVLEILGRTSLPISARRERGHRLIQRDSRTTASLVSQVSR